MIMTTQEMNEMIQKEKGGKENFYVIVFKASDEASEKYVLADLHNSFVGDQDYIDSDIILNDYSLRRLTNSPYRGEPFEVHLYIFPDDCIEPISMDRLRCLRLRTVDKLKNVYLLNEGIAPDEVKKFVDDCNDTIKYRKRYLQEKEIEDDEDKRYIIVFEAKSEELSRSVLSTVCSEFVGQQDYIDSSVVINDYVTREPFNTKPTGNTEDIQVSIFFEELVHPKTIERLITTLDTNENFFDNMKGVYIINKQYASDEIKTAVDRYNKLIKERND